MSTQRGRKLKKSPKTSPKNKAQSIERSPQPPEQPQSLGSSFALRTSSPLNPNVSPKSSPSITPQKKPVDLPDPGLSSSPRSSLDIPRPQDPTITRPRVRSLSTVLEGDLAAVSLHRSSSAASISIAELQRASSEPGSSLPRGSESLPVSVKSHSPTPSRRGLSPERLTFQVEVQEATPHGTLSRSWWPKPEVAVNPRPWFPTPPRPRPIPSEQSEGWVQTRERVAKAAVSVLGTTGDIAHEVLLASVDLLGFAPIPGLEPAAKVLLRIWDIVQQVDMNRLACLRLTERCANILFSIREELMEDGDIISRELDGPIAKLVQTFVQIQNFWEKQMSRPFLKRYLKRDEIVQQIAACDVALSDSLSMFNTSIHLRMFRQQQFAEQRRQADQQAMMSLLNDLASQGRSLPSRALAIEGPPTRNALQLTDISEPSEEQSDISASVPGLANLPKPTAPPEDIRARLRAMHDQENEMDQARDLEDLRQIMRYALQANNDVEMIDVLQVSREEMPEALKALLRALEWETDRSNNVLRQVDSVDDLEMASASSATIRPVELMRSLTGNSTSASTITGNRSLHSVPSDSDPSTVSTIDTLDREFIESGIDALRRLSREPEVSLPSWIITRYEVDREEKIGVGFFSTVYRGTWRNQRVAIKVLADTTPRKLYEKEIAIWKSLDHPNVLALLGASSPVGDTPWFFVSCYCENGTLVSFLKTARSLEDVNVLWAMQSIAKGMTYLHGKGVLHGDLKASNVLVDSQHNFLVSDFGQSELKSEAVRLSGQTTHGTLRWQAPEILKGVNHLTTHVDVYAYAICCVEILAKGAIPWPLLDDSAVTRLVLDEGRPSLPSTHVSSHALTMLIQRCWHEDPFKRPDFSEVVRDMDLLRRRFGSFKDDSPLPFKKGLLDNERIHSSPDIRPDPLPESQHDGITTRSTGSTGSNASYTTASLEFQLPGGNVMTRTECDTGRLPSTKSSYSSLYYSSSSHSDSALEVRRDSSPAPIIPAAEESRNERRYRLLLSHTFHRSLTLPLWSPTYVTLGAVGYLSKPEGRFITLFNALDPTKSSGGLAKGLPSVRGYGDVSFGKQTVDKRTTMQKGYDAIHELLRSQTGHRRYTFDLRADQKVALLITEITTYHYMQSLDAAKQWFKRHIQYILKLYGRTHKLQKEDIFLIIGTLNAPDYGLFVSHVHLDSRVHFDVSAAPRDGQKWGKFTLDERTPVQPRGGPVYKEVVPTPSQHASKVSTVNQRRDEPNLDAVLLARLRFKTDAAEPTSL